SPGGGPARRRGALDRVGPRSHGRRGRPHGVRRCPHPRDRHRPGRCRMSVTDTGSLVVAAAASGKAVVAVNVITLEHAEAIVGAASQSGRSLVLQLSQNAISYHGRGGAVTRAVHALSEDAPVPLAVHLDHLTDPALVSSV